MELRQYLNVVGKWLWLIVLSVSVASVSSYLVSRSAAPVYVSKTTLMVGRITQNPDPSSADLNMGQQLALTYAQLAKREPVLRGVIDELGLDMQWDALAGQVSANVIPQTQLLEIRVVDNDPQRAKLLADAIAQQLIIHSPTTPSDVDQKQLVFTKEQLNDLQAKIEDARQQSASLKQELDNANSSRLIQDLQNQMNILDTKVSNWQNTYSQLLASIQGGSINALSVVEVATVPNVPIGPDAKANVLLAALIGLVLSTGGAFLIEYFEDTVREPEEVSRITGLPVIGYFPTISGTSTARKLIAASHPLSPVVESFRMLRTNLQYSAIDKPIQTLMITSAGPGEGKSLLLANLAVVIAQSNLKVILVDTDLRRPVLHHFFELSNRGGLSNAMIGPKVSVTSFLLKTNVPNLFLLPSGSLPPNPAEMLGSERMRGFIEELKNEADIVLFDTPPALLVADAAILSRQLDSAILAVDAQHTRRKDIRQVMEELNRIHVRLSGIVLNHYQRNKGYYYQYRAVLTEEEGKRGKVRNGRFDDQAITQIPDEAKP